MFVFKYTKTRKQELNPKWLHNLHEGVYNKYQYMRKMAISVAHGGLWRDFTTIKWISHYLQRLIYIWHKDSFRIISIFGFEFQLEPLHLAFGTNHFEPIEKLN